MVSDEMLESMKKKIGDDKPPMGYDPSGASSIVYSQGQIGFSIARNYEKTYFGVNMSEYSKNYSGARDYGQNKGYEKRKIYSID